MAGPALAQDRQRFFAKWREQIIDLLHAGGDEQQAFVDFAPFQRKYAKRGIPVERVAAKPPYGFGGIGDYAAAPQDRRRAPAPGFGPGRPGVHCCPCNSRSCA